MNEHDVKQAQDAAQQAGRQARQRIQDGRDWLERNRPWSYIGLVMGGMLIILLTGNMLVWLAFVLYVVVWVFNLLVMTAEGTRIAVQQGDGLGRAPRAIAWFVRTVAPLWGLIFAGLVVDGILGTHFFANPLTGLASWVGAQWLVTRAITHPTQHAGTLRGGQTNTTAPQAAPRRRGGYADVMAAADLHAAQQQAQQQRPEVPPMVVTPVVQQVAVTAQPTSAPPRKRQSAFELLDDGKQEEQP